MTILRITEEKLAKQVEKFLFEAIKPGGFAEVPIPIPTLKDRLAWLTWANLMRPEQPTFVALERDKIVGVIVGEPIEQWFDEGESEIQDIICLPEHDTLELIQQLMKKIIAYYVKNNAKQIHVWCLKEAYDSKKLNYKCDAALNSFKFEFKGKEVISKWSGKKILKLEKYL